MRTNKIGRFNWFGHYTCTSNVHQTEQKKDKKYLEIDIGLVEVDHLVSFLCFTAFDVAH